MAYNWRVYVDVLSFFFQQQQHSTTFKMKDTHVKRDTEKIVKNSFIKQPYEKKNLQIRALTEGFTAGCTLVWFLS